MNEPREMYINIFKALNATLQIFEDCQHKSPIEN